jgi:hypothetical protein
LTGNSFLPSVTLFCNLLSWALSHQLIIPNHGKDVGGEFTVGFFFWQDGVISSCYVVAMVSVVVVW